MINAHVQFTHTYYSSVHTGGCSQVLLSRYTKQADIVVGSPMCAPAQLYKLA